MDNHGQHELDNSPAIRPDDGSPIFPMKVYIFSKDGTYGAPLIVESDDQLWDTRTKAAIREAITRGVEVRVTDPMDFLLFHAKDGKVVFDGKELREGDAAQG